MITAAFLVGLAAILTLLTVLLAARNALRARSAQALGRELARVLADVTVTDLSAATGRFDDLPIRLALGPALLVAHVALPDAALDYDELITRFASDALQQRLAALGVEGTREGQVRLTLVRERATADTLATLARRLEVVREVRDLRRFAPAELLGRVSAARSAAEVDATLDALVRVFPDAPETRAAFAAALARDRDPRLLARAQAALA